MSYVHRKSPKGNRVLTVSSTAIGTDQAKDSAATVQGIPAGTDFVLIRNCASAADVRYTVDGSAPTATFGMLLKAGEFLNFDGDPSVLKFIRTATTDAEIHLECHGV